MTSGSGHQGGSSNHPSAGKHPIYRGIRCRGGKWVSEIREPRKTTRIWLGTFPTPEMAAAAYDVALLALKGSDATLNFPESVHSYPIPASASPLDIRNAAAAAAASRLPRAEEAGNNKGYHDNRSNTPLMPREEFLDEEAIFDMPALLVNMAQGMLVEIEEWWAQGEMKPMGKYEVELPETCL
ncbi:hypothetical protein HHK36_033308 [Tetracentron sinense]|uniref:AP2/ERF domain-containing protein n=1 Tax=Tetracentron sinense TaxID=13715 RepID=A0A834Y689_TETSI|nr:hypothetical protein HHK36_033308 [Tetracentron sinense]